ncbi:hypothetical protein UlMin_035176 [Ulmus minor]
MSTISSTDKPHAVCIPFPAQGHISPMLKLAKLLHFKGFHITFVNTEFNHNRLLKSRGPEAIEDLPSFRFEKIPDGLPPTDVEATQDIPSLCDSVNKTCLAPFRELLSKLNSSMDVPPVTCVVSDGAMSFTIDAAEEFGIPEVLFWTTSACGFMGYLHYQQLVDKGFTPFKDWIPGMKDIRLKDLPSFFRTTNPQDIMVNHNIFVTKRAPRASAIILNTFYALEQEVLDAFKSVLHPPVYPIGFLHLILNQIPYNNLKSFGSNLWKEDTKCLEWLDSKEPNSVVYVNFGSITVMTLEQLVEFAWGLANSNKSFLWVIRPDLVAGDSAVLPPEFVEETKERSLLTSWCPQEQVLSHPAVGGFLTHSGWNSTIESISAGVPMLCWPFFAEQQTNCRYCCEEWGIGMEIESDAKREEIERLVRLLMEGDKGKEMKEKAENWKRLADEATCSTSKSVESSSFFNLEKLIHQVLLSQCVKDSI